MTCLRLDTSAPASLSRRTALPRTRPARRITRAFIGRACAIVIALQTASAQAPPPSAVYADVAERILQSVAQGHDGYRKLEELCDDIGHRLSGSEGLERAIDWAVWRLAADGHENVRTQPVMVPKWVRGNESLHLVEPRAKELAMLGLGGSISTPPEGITAEVISVASSEELSARSAEAAGRIVLFNSPMSPPDGRGSGGGYGAAVQYRVAGARMAAQHGAVAALVRSVTARSLRSPHTGGMNYFEAGTRIPAAAVSVEDAELLTRMLARGQRVVVTLKMEARDEGLSPSANVIAELTGRERPDEVVVIGGHLDSWDVGTGAQDDAGGCVICMEALSVLRRLGLRPRRTIRVVLFTNEENGLAGGRAYAAGFAGELPGHVAAIESDAGMGAPLGFGVSHKDDDIAACAAEQLADIVRLLAPIGADRAEPGGGGADISPMRPAGVPLLGHDVDMTHYFDIHHTHADTLDKIDPENLRKNIAAMAIVAYVLADMPGRLGEID